MSLWPLPAFCFVEKSIKGYLFVKPYTIYLYFRITLNDGINPFFNFIPDTIDDRLLIMIPFMAKRILPMKKFLCFAHRGASGHEPENTLSAVEKAIFLGADWVEVDVYAIEGELIVFHDERLERTTNGLGHLLKKTMSYLRSLDAGGGQQIPMLREIFDLVNKRIGINIELKGKETAPLVIKIIDEYVINHGWSYEQFIVSSFNHRELYKVRENQPRILTGLVLDSFRRRYKAFARRYGLYSVHMRMDLINDRFIAAAKKMGLKVFAYTVNNPEDIEIMKKMGVDGIFTDFPERGLSL